MDTDEYYMGIAIAVSKRANCLGRKVGAVLVKENRIISTGYNGTPENVKNCIDGGCVRCTKKREYSPANYDICICVHAEQNSIVTAARFGIAIAGSTAYSTLQPCFNCTKEMLQAGVCRVVYREELGSEHKDPDVHQMYVDLQNKFPDGICKLPMDDSDSDWANGKNGSSEQGQVLDPACE
jgi:dCMP deaminase